MTNRPLSQPPPPPPLPLHVAPQHHDKFNISKTIAPVTKLNMPEKAVAKALPKNALAFPDCFAGRRFSLDLVAGGKLQSPAQLRAQIMRPLELMQAAAWFYARQSPGMKRHREKPPPPLSHMLTQFSPCVPVRLMCGCVATACRRLATAPAGVYVIHRTTGRWVARIMDRVTRGQVNKVQVTWCSCSGAHAVLCPWRSSACVCCVFDACCR
jgi:hypothetical protein